MSLHLSRVCRKLETFLTVPHIFCIFLSNNTVAPSPVILHPGSAPEYPLEKGVIKHLFCEFYTIHYSQIDYSQMLYWFIIYYIIIIIILLNAIY